MKYRFVIMGTVKAQEQFKKWRWKGSSCYWL